MNYMIYRRKKSKQLKAMSNLCILQAHCQSHTIQLTDQSIVKELAKPTQEKIVFKKFPALEKI